MRARATLAQGYECAERSPPTVSRGRAGTKQAQPRAHRPGLPSFLSCGLTDCRPLAAARTKYHEAQGEADDHAEERGRQVQRLVRRGAPRARPTNPGTNLGVGTLWRNPWTGAQLTRRC